MKITRSVALFFLLSLLAFFPALFGNVPLNTRNLVAFFSPWYYEKFPGFPIGVPSKPGMLDQLRIYYPYMKLTQQSYRLGELPLWNPYNFLGNPHMAEWQSGAFYPLHILLPFFPLPVYWTFFQITGFFLAGLFTYLFLRNVGLGELPSILGGTTYMLSSFMTTWNMEVVVTSHSILWLPLILLAIDKIIDRKQKTENKKQWWLVGLLSIVFSILSGYWQTTLYVMGVSALYGIFRLFQFITQRSSFRVPKSVVLIFAWFPLALGLTAFHLFPTSELYGRSSRPAVNRSAEIQQILLSYLLPVRHLATLFAPDYFGHPTTRNYFANVGGGTYYEHVLFVGTLPVVLAVIALVAGQKKRRWDIVFWILIGIISASFSFNTPWARLVYALNVPVLSTGIANRILFVEAFSLAVLSACGLEATRKMKNSNILLGMLGIGIILTAILAVQTALTKTSLGALDVERNPTLYLVSLRNMVIPSVVFFVGILALIIGIFRLRWLTLSLGFVVILSNLQNLYQHYKFTPFSESQFIYPVHSTIDWLQKNAGLNRFIGYNGQFLNNNFATFFGIYAVEGYDSLNDFRRSMLIHSSVKGTLADELPRSADATLGADLTNPRILRLMQLFGVRYLVDHPEYIEVGKTDRFTRLSDEHQKLVFQDRDWKIWEYLDALPRAFLVGNYEAVGDGQPTIDRLYSDDFDPRSSILLTPDSARLLPADIAPDLKSSAEIVSRTPNSMTVTIHSLTNQLLFVSDTWYPGWHAKLENGQKLPVLTADYALRAIPVPAGEHTVKMYYFPESFKNGLLTSGAILIVMALVVFLKKGKR